MEGGGLEARFARLTNRQKDCLQLVAQGYTSKEIGRQLGISFSTVDNHIQAAMQLLQVEGRAEAGRLYAQLASDEAGQRLPSQPAAIATVYPELDGSSVRQGWRQKLTSLLPPVGGQENPLSPSQSSLAIVRIAFLAALAFIACVMIVKMSFRALS